MAMEADAKTFSLFSAQSPVGLGGYFAAPAINPVSPELIARTGAGVAAGLVLSPLAAVIAFIDPGDADAAACGPVLQGARATAQRTKMGEARKDRSEEHTSELQSLMRISYAVFCLKKKKKQNQEMETK